MVEIIPPRPMRGWWLYMDDGLLHCSVCGAVLPISQRDKRKCSCCGACMTIDETYVKRLLERGYRRQRSEAEGETR